MDDATSRRILDGFADLLTYPGAGLGAVAHECAALVSPLCPEAAALLSEFAAFARRARPGRLEELYTSTFDLGASCHPYVGHYLFGERHERSAFMVALREHYRAVGLEPGGELPDHLALVLRYLALGESSEPAQELIAHALLPALAGMLGDQRGSAEHVGEAAAPPQATETHSEARRASPYAGVLEALRLILRHQVETVGCAPEGGDGRG